jgi:hypothetical protein
LFQGSTFIEKGKLPRFIDVCFLFYLIISLFEIKYSSSVTQDRYMNEPSKNLITWNYVAWTCYSFIKPTNALVL